jgi:hypothetical protein
MSKIHRALNPLIPVLCILSWNIQALKAKPTDGSDCQSKKITLITINHKTDSIRCCTDLDKDGNPKNGCEGKIISGNTVAISTSAFRLRIVDTHTALYDYRISSENINDPETEKLEKFLTGFKPYLADLAAFLPSKGLSTTKPPSQEPITSISSALKALDAALYGPDGLKNTLVTILDLLNRTRNNPSELTAKLDSTIGGRFVGGSVQSHTLVLRDPVCHAFKVLTEQFDSLSVAIDDPANNGKQDLLKKLQTQAAQAIDDSGKLFGQIAEVEELAKSVYNARDNLTDNQQYAVSLQEGKKITIKITPKSSLYLHPLADLDEKEWQITVVKDWRVHFGLGLSIFFSPRSTFPVYGTKSKGDSTAVTESSRSTNQVDYALSLGLRIKQRGSFSIWFPELSINPSDKIRSLGLGGSVSYGIFKFCVGCLWTKHTALDNQRLDQVLASADGLKTKETYGFPSDGRFYIGFSLIGWSPFKP